MDDEELEALIDQAINGAVAAIPMHLNEIRQNKKVLHVDNVNEFVYGLIMGLTLGICSSILTAQKNVPTQEEQFKIRDLLHKKIPKIRKEIFK